MLLGVILKTQPAQGGVAVRKWTAHAIRKEVVTDLANEHFFDDCLHGVFFNTAANPALRLILGTLTKRHLRATVRVELRPH